MDSWLRQVFVPPLSDNVRFVLCGRDEPVTAWLSAPGWHGLFKALRLDSPDQASAREFLSRAGVPPKEAKRLEGVCHGHPLALTLAASLQGSGWFAKRRTRTSHRYAVPKNVFRRSVAAYEDEPDGPARLLDFRFFQSINSRE
jgi:hypothetical protein